MSLKLSKYLRILRESASQLERTNINGVVDNSWVSKYLFKIIFALLSALLVYLVKNGFNSDFVSFVASVLSILVGLFITALVFSFDKFYRKPKDTETASSQIKLWEKQAYNYTKKFTFITSRTIVLCVFTLVLLAVSALFKEGTLLNVFTLEFDFTHLSIESIELFFVALFLIIQRFLVLYWLLKIMYNTLFIVGSMVQYMTTILDR